MNIQTIFQAGNSQVVAIPKNLLDEMKLKIGEKVAVEKASEDVLTIKRIKVTTKSARADAEFKKWSDSFLAENGEILDELASR